MSTASRIALLLGAIATGSIHAQMIGWDTVLPLLDKEDMAIMAHTARQEMDGKPDGTVLEWRNPASGASGKVTLLKSFVRDGQPCRTVRHHFRVPNQYPWEFEGIICRQGDGEWKVLEQGQKHQVKSED